MLLQLVAHLAQHREGGIDRVVDDLVQQAPGALERSRFARLLVAAAALEQVLDGSDRLVGQGDHEVGPHEQVQLGGVQAPDGVVVAREVQDDEQVLVVLIDLRALVARQHVFVVQRMEVEVLLQPGAIDGAGALDVDPAQPDLLDDLGLGLLRRLRARRLRTRERAVRLNRGLGRLGISTSGVVAHWHSPLGPVYLRLGRGRSP